MIKSMSGEEMETNPRCDTPSPPTALSSICFGHPSLFQTLHSFAGIIPGGGGRATVSQTGGVVVGIVCRGCKFNLFGLQDLPVLLHLATVNHKHHIINCDRCLSNVGRQDNLSHTFLGFPMKVIITTPYEQLWITA